MTHCSMKSTAARRPNSARCAVWLTGSHPVISDSSMRLSEIHRVALVAIAATSHRSGVSPARRSSTAICSSVMWSVLNAHLPAVDRPHTREDTAS